jgi:RNA polymerase sigma-54 factor
LSVGIKLEQVQTQRLNLTPELVQSIKILQQNSVELENYIQEELMSNPMLELSDNQPDFSREEKDNRFDWTEHAKERSYDDLSSRRLTESEKGDYNYEQFVKARYSLYDFLHMQLTLIPGLDPKTRKIAEYIIDSLNPWGYRTERATEIAVKLDCEHDEVMKAIHVVQSLEPAGVGAKSLQEALMLQLKRMGEYNEVFADIITNHLQNIANNRIQMIAKALNLSLDETNEYCDELRSLDPKPGVRYGKNDENSYIKPDVYVKEDRGKYLIFANEKITPLLNTSPYYEKLLAEAAGDEETTEYIKSKMNSAVWLIKGIDQRRRTIQKVAEAIVAHQQDFFKKGSSALRPMTLSDIAEELDIHESTVSRAVNGKYMQTPRGLFEMKFFFSGSVSGSTGDDMSQEAARQAIKEIVANEDPKKPLSDEKIKEKLYTEHKIDIARRTVAKYREQLGIPGTSKRKKY